MKEFDSPLEIVAWNKIITLDYIVFDSMSLIFRINVVNLRTLGALPFRHQYLGVKQNHCGRFTPYSAGKFKEGHWSFEIWKKITLLLNKSTHTESQNRDNRLTIRKGICLESSLWDFLQMVYLDPTKDFQNWHLHLEGQAPVPEKYS